MVRNFRASKVSIPRLRRWLIVALTGMVIGVTLAVSILVQRIFDNFGPGVASDLEWKTQRGAQELARAVDLGLAVQDTAAVTQQFGDYRGNEDVVAIVAEASGGLTVASYGNLPALDGGPFAGPPMTVRPVGTLLVAWAPAVIEGSSVGRVSLVVTTKRLVRSRALLRRLSLGTFASGLITWILGFVFVRFFTRNIAARDVQLADYASGLEKKVSERTVELARINQGMRLVLDNVVQGFITIDLAGLMSPERSTVCDRWFGPPQPRQSFVEVVAASDPTAAEWFDLGLAEIREAVLPLELLLGQLPAQMSLGPRTLRLTYRPIFGAMPAAASVDERGGGSGQGQPERLLIVLTDITDELARERIERDSRETIQLFERIASDRQGFIQFLNEGDALIASLAEGAGAERGGTAALEVERRVLHTLKGNAGIQGLESVANLCHELETKLRDENRAVNEAEYRSLAVAWAHVRAIVSPLLGERRAAVELSEDEHQALLAALRGGASREELLGMVMSWSRESVAVRFQRLTEKVQYLARRMGKPPLLIHKKDNGIRLESCRWSGFWAACVHVLNNTLDHGIELPEARRQAGKPESGQLWMEAEQTERHLIITLRDDGRGIDWDQVAATAAARGLPHQTDEDLREALFTDGVSSRDTATLTSGRGIGMGALRHAARALGGYLEVTSVRGQGTALAFRFPREAQAGFGRAA